MSSCVRVQAKRGKAAEINALYRKTFNCSADSFLVVDESFVQKEIERIKTDTSATLHHVSNYILTVDDWNLVCPEFRLGAGSVPIGGFMFERNPDEAKRHAKETLQFILQNKSLFREIRHLDQACLFGMVSPESLGQEPTVRTRSASTSLGF